MSGNAGRLKRVLEIRKAWREDFLEVDMHLETAVSGIASTRR